MKAIVAICAIAILIGAPVYTQVPAPAPCTTFDDNQLHGWAGSNATAVTASGHGGAFADVRDQSGGSTFVAPPAYRGNWLKFVNDCGELCFDINILDDGWASTSNPVSVSFTISDGTHTASFIHNPIVEGSGWRTFCAPIGPLIGGNLPNNGQGLWKWSSGTNADWQPLLQNVTDFRFSVDFASSSAQSEHFQIDNICFHANTCAKADFGVVSTCAGTPVTIPNQSAGATSSSWTLPGGTPSSSTSVSPNVVWAGAGSFPVKLCINGGTAAPLCTTKTIIVNAAPAVPIITGPTTSCQNPATYCVTNPQAGVSYSWFATGGTVNPASGTCTAVNWTSAGVIAVTATNKAGCKSSRRMEVAGCTTHNPCCDKPQFKIDSWSMPLTGGHYVFTPVLTTAGPVKRVVIDVINADIAYSSPACGTAHTFLPSISALHSVSGFGSWQPVANSTEAVWYASTGVPLNLVAFPIELTLPPHSGLCTDTVHFCVKYTVTNGECRTCEIVQCYTFTRKLNIDTPAEENNNPLPN